MVDQATSILKCRKKPHHDATACFSNQNHQEMLHGAQAQLDTRVSGDVEMEELQYADAFIVGISQRKPKSENVHQDFMASADTWQKKAASSTKMSHKANMIQQLMMFALVTHCFESFGLTSAQICSNHPNQIEICAGTFTLHNPKGISANNEYTKTGSIWSIFSQCLKFDPLTRKCGSLECTRTAPDSATSCTLVENIDYPHISHDTNGALKTY